MKTRFAGVCHVLALTLLAGCCLSVAAFAADNDTMPAHPRFTIIPPKPALPGQNLSGTLQEWNGSFTYNNTTYNYVMVGADPSTNQGALVTTYLIPVKLVLSDGSVWDPLAGGPTSPLAETVLSPVFDHTTTYIQGGVNVGTTQYIDAFQRANFWSIVENNPGSHLLLGGPTRNSVQVLPEITLNVPAASGHQGVEFGVHVALVDINYYDEQISNYLAQSQTINPTTFPIFLNANTYLTEGGCCIGGYHSANGPQTYANFEYITTPGVFSQDVSALSHEVGEWADDPLYPNPNGNQTPCGILEVGDPLEGGQPGHPYGTWPYVLHGFTYHLQDLVTLKYFGGDPNMPVNGYWTFQGYTGITQICEDGS